MLFENALYTLWAASSVLIEDEDDASSSCARARVAAVAIYSLLSFTLGVFPVGKLSFNPEVSAFPSCLMEFSTCETFLGGGISLILALLPTSSSVSRQNVFTKRTCFRYSQACKYLVWMPCDVRILYFSYRFLSKKPVLTSWETIALVVLTGRFTLLLVT